MVLNNFLLTFVNLKLTEFSTVMILFSFRSIFKNLDKEQSNHQNAKQRKKILIFQPHLVHSGPYYASSPCGSGLSIIWRNILGKISSKTMVLNHNNLEEYLESNMFQDHTEMRTTPVAYSKYASGAV